MFRRDAHCTFCGTAYPNGIAGWPRSCGHCRNTSYRNPLPVAVVLQPVGDGLLVIRRGIEPRKGFLALPGGYVDFNEPWQHAAVRELHEETGIVADPAAVTLFDLRSATDNTLVIFALTPPLALADLAAFEPTDETTERAVVEKPAELAFPLHTDVMLAYFARRS
jgi:ADP-ribose pyrophosphatase YjhB (NUDIX family)